MLKLNVTLKKAFARAVVGLKEKWVSQLAKRSCDGVYLIPMKNSLNSLNVSVAAAIFMYEILRQNLNIS